MTDGTEYLRAGDIAQLTGMSLRTIRRWIADEIVPSTIAGDKRLSTGLAVFHNWCGTRGITPEEANAAFKDFGAWLDERTLYPRPRDVLRRVPQLWNEASDKITIWPKAKLAVISFRAPSKRHQWSQLSESLRRDTEAYCAMRENPDPFDERPNAPTQLAASTIRQQRMHIRLAASILIDSGIPVEEIASLADLVEPERFKKFSATTIRALMRNRTPSWSAWRRPSFRWPSST